MGLIKKFNGDVLQWMRGFYFAATTNSISAAARELGVNRAAIRHHLRRLEEELGVTLFERSQDKLQVTAEGLRLLEWCKTIFEVMEKLVGDMAYSGANIRGSIRIGTQHHIALHVLQKPIVDFLEQYPNTDIEIKTGVLGEMQAMLENREVDVGVCAEPEHIDPYNFSLLYRTSLTLIAPKGRFAIPPKPKLADLASLPLIMLSAGTPHPNYYELLEQHGFTPQKKLTVNSDLIALEYARAGLGVAMLRGQHYITDPEGLEAYRLEQVSNPTSIGLLTLKTAYMSPAVLMFMDFCKEWFAYNKICYENDKIC